MRVVDHSGVDLPPGDPGEIRVRELAIDADRRRPGAVEVVGELPRNPSGKAMTLKLRDQLAAGGRS